MTDKDKIDAIKMSKDLICGYLTRNGEYSSTSAYVEVAMINNDINVLSQHIDFWLDILNIAKERIENGKNDKTN